MSEAHGLNIRFLCQGMMKLGADQLPPGFFSWPGEDQIRWAQEYWDKRSREDILGAVAYLTVEEDSVPDCLEVDGDDYPVLAETPAWKAFNAPNSQVLNPVEEEQ